jgi:hypothetical protein
MPQTDVTQIREMFELATRGEWDPVLAGFAPESSITAARTNPTAR